MIPEGPIARYLSDLRRGLPFPAPRLVSETREHLLESTAAAISSGSSHEEAEAKAVSDYGPVEDVVAAVLKDGSALMSPSVTAWIRLLALALCFPTLVFVFVNLIEVMAGNEGGVGVFGTFFDGWHLAAEGLLVFGPLLALALIVLTSVRISRERGTGGLSATIDVRMSRWTVGAALIALITTVAVIGYGIAENYPTWRDFRDMSWTCTVEPDSNRQVCYSGTDLAP